MIADGTNEQRVETVRRLADAADQAYRLARSLHEEIARIRQWERGSRVTPMAYSLGICFGDVEIAANRLGGLRNELEDLASRLDAVSDA